MAGGNEKAIAIIMVGGPTVGTRFRPLTLHTAKPLMPVAGQPMVHHPIEACKKIPNLQHIFLMGFYEEKDFSLYLSSVASNIQVPVRYLKEPKALGSAGGVLYFKDILLQEDPQYIFVINTDVCCSFPLEEMLGSFKKTGGLGTLLVKRVSPEAASDFGELVADAETGELLHYAERPETFVSEKINCGVYVFTPELFTAIETSGASRKTQAQMRRISSFGALQSVTKPVQADYFRFDQDVFQPNAGKKLLYTYETLDFWEQIKTPALALRCSDLYFQEMRKKGSEVLAKPGDGIKTPTVKGDVFIHTSAKVHPTAKIGPNVSIMPNARIGPGVRLLNCIILDGVEIQDNAIVMNSIVGWKSVVGRWARIQGRGDYNSKLGVSILGEDITVEDEVVVVSCICLPHKELKASVRDEIIL